MSRQNHATAVDGFKFATWDGFIRVLMNICIRLSENPAVTLSGIYQRNLELIRKKTLDCGIIHHGIVGLIATFTQNLILKWISIFNQCEWCGCKIDKFNSFGEWKSNECSQNQSKCRFWNFFSSFSLFFCRLVCEICR